MTALFANYASTTVTSGGLDVPSAGSSETWTVESSSLFPAASSGAGTYFHVADPQAPTELMTVTNVSGTTWTVTRGAESTSPVLHNPNFAVWAVASAGDLANLESSVASLNTSVASLNTSVT
jgi:hypothetical protein